MDADYSSDLDPDPLEEQPGRSQGNVDEPQRKPMQTKRLLKAGANVARAASTVLSPLDGAIDMLGSSMLHRWVRPA